MTATYPQSAAQPYSDQLLRGRPGLQVPLIPSPQLQHPGMAGSRGGVTGTPGQPLLNRHQVGGVFRSPDGLFAQQEREPIGGRPAVRGKRTYGGRPGQRVEEQGTWASHTQKHSEAGYGRPVDRGAWTAKTVKRPRQQPAQPPIRQLLGAADAQTAHHATFSTPNTPTIGLRERGNDTSKSTGRSGRQKAATRRNMRREDRGTVQDPVKEQQPDGMSHGGLQVGVSQVRSSMLPRAPRAIFVVCCPVSLTRWEWRCGGRVRRRAGLL